MLGKFIKRGLSTAASENAAASTTSATTQITIKDIYQNAGYDPVGIPRAKQSAFRKRPVKLNYDQNEYYSFRLPSEETSLLGNFDRDEIFGKRQGINHSPHIQAQINLDNRLLLLIGGLTVYMVLTLIPQTTEIQRLRKQYRRTDMGRF